MNKMIACADLSKKYNDKCVIDRFSGVFPETGLYLLLGESGSGKTSFLNVLAGFQPFEEGTVYWDGEAFAERVMHPEEPSFDYITQENFFVDFLTVEENLLLLKEGLSGKMSESAFSARVLEGLERFGLGDKRDAFPSTLSGGERGRLAILRALLKGKRVLLLDEPTAALDEDNKKKIFDTLYSLKSSILILCATHDKAAIPYADAILHFSKKEKTPRMEYLSKRLPPDAKGDKEAGGDEASSSAHCRKRRKKKNELRGFLRKWMRSSKREQRVKGLYVLFLMLSFLLVLLADTPAHKYAVTSAEMYHINTIQLSVVRGKQLSDFPFERSEVDEIVVDYRGSCPVGTELYPGEDPAAAGIRYDSFIWTLPEEEKRFLIKDAVAFGTYFTDPEQVILSYEMAESLMPGQHEKLIGKTIKRSFFKLGMVDLTIVGIFRQFTYREQVYANSCGAEYNLENYNPENTKSLFYVNAALTKPLVDDPDFFHDEGQRAFIFYFDTCAARNSFLTAHRQDFNWETGFHQMDTLYPLTDWKFPSLFRIYMPFSVLIIIFTVAFYAELGRTEFAYNNTFVSVFEYAGYSKKRIIRELVLAQTAEFLRLLGIGAGLAGVLSAAGNALNTRLQLVDYELFTYNPWLLALCLGTIIGMTFVILALRFRKVKLNSWYENLIANRDVL